MNSDSDAVGRLSAALTGRYTIERELGAGGMATVYLAHDIKHGRDVALKVLRPELAESMGRERFLREIQLAAKLAHPHVLPLHDSGDADGALFFVMPNVEGHSLRDRMNVGRMTVADAVRITCEVAGALHYAHRHDVVHRDIKPENIMLQDGHAMVADFGIGKAVSDVEGNTLTQAGVSVGTPAYMSPEQAVGEAVDGRSDLYSLACVLYEMLVGEPPFTGPNVQAVIAKRFVQTPADVTALREGVPRPVARALQKALSRTPIDRYDTGALFAAALAEADAPVSAAKAPEKSLAVMPFASLSRDPDDEFFADGVTEEILNALSQIPGLQVAGRSSSFSFKGRNEDLRTIGAKLNVATILEGTLRRSGSRLRITVQLIDAADGYQLWSERYERVIEDVFAVQDEIAATIAARLRVSLAAPSGAARAPTRNLEAYELYLKGRALLYQRGPSIAKAIECFQQAVTLDAEYAQAWAGLADGFTTTAHGGFARARDVMPKALDAARRALQLDPDLSEAHSALACATLLWERDYDLAGREFRRSMELNPNYAQGRAWYGLWYLHWACGRSDEAGEVLTRLCEIDPMSGYAHVIMGFYNMTRGHTAEGVEDCRRGVALDPSSYLAQWTLCGALSSDGQYEEAAAAGERALEMSRRHGWALATQATIYADWGKLDRARELYAELSARAEHEYVQPAMASFAAAKVLGVDEGLALLRRAVEERDPVILTLVRSWPPMAVLQADPRFYEIVRPLNLPNFGPPAT